METRIIKANISYLPFLEDLEKQCFQPFQQTLRRGLRLSLSSQFQAVFIAQVKENMKWIAGGALVLHQHKKTLRIYSIGILPKYQKIGLGRKLMEYGIEMARLKLYEKISLEALASNHTLIAWYELFGFIVKDRVPHYYAPDIDAVRMVLSLNKEEKKIVMGNIIVVDHPKQFNIHAADIEVVSAKQYISGAKYKNLKSARVFNLCNSYKYQTEGYYVSLLASARDHRVIPSVTTIGDYKNHTFIKSISVEIDELIQKTFSGEKDNKASLNIYFGQTTNEKYKQLAAKVYNIFETPLIKVEFQKSKIWEIHRVKPLNINQLSSEDKEQLPFYVERFFARKRFHRPRLKNYKYDLAILINPDEKTPPSCKRALEKFRKAADKCGFYCEFITRDDFNRVSEFDALFIRETTNVNNYTYMFSRLAYAEGLAVIDDPWSILRCSNKIFLHERMLLNKIPVPQSKILSKSGFKASDVADLSFPLVLKQPDGSFSIGVSKVNNTSELEESLKVLFKSSDLIIAQNFMPSDYDWRIGIIDQQALFACKYYMAKGHWQIYNWKKNGKESYGNHVTVPIEEVPANVIETAIKAASLMGDGFYGVDLKEVDGKVFIIEINDNPNVDNKIEDAVLKDELYLRIMQSILNRIEMSRNISRYIAADPVNKMP